MSNYLDAAIATALGAGDRFLNIFGLDKDYLTGGYDQLRSFLGPHVQYPLGLIGLDVDYLVWLLCVLAPIIFAFVLPLITVTVFYLCICVINFVKFKHHFYQVMFDVLLFRMKQEKFVQASFLDWALWKLEESRSVGLRNYVENFR